MAKFNYTIVFVGDMGKAVAFYRDTLGLPLKFESPDWSEFATETTTLALHKAGRTPAGSCNPGFLVDDLHEFHKQMQARGVKCLQPPKVEEFGGVLAVYADPDGLPISVWSMAKK